MKMDKTELREDAFSVLKIVLENIEGICQKQFYRAAELELDHYYGMVAMLYFLDIISEAEHEAKYEEGLRRYHAARYPEEAQHD